MNLKEAFTTLPQYLLPHHSLSRMMGLLTHAKNKTWKNLFIQQVIKHYNVNMDDALEEDINTYANFNEFFTRQLKPEIRPLAREDNAIISPADGAISQSGNISNGEIFQAKGKSFSTINLLGGSEERSEPFENGKFMTIYLSPKDYHRLHMPLTGTLTEMVHIPGRLFSVNNATANSVPELFARNERLACIFDTEAGPMALVLVGAIFVSSIETVWDGVITPPTVKEVQTSQYPYNPPQLQRGHEMGRFNMGSTIIVLFGKNKISWKPEFTAGKTVNMGELIGISRMA